MPPVEGPETTHNKVRSSAPFSNRRVRSLTAISFSVIPACTSSKISFSACAVICDALRMYSISSGDLMTRTSRMI